MALRFEFACDLATFDGPFRYSRGIPHVFIDGIAVRDVSVPTLAVPGKALRKAGQGAFRPQFGHIPAFFGFFIQSSRNIA